MRWMLAVAVGLFAMGCNDIGTCGDLGTMAVADGTFIAKSDGGADIVSESYLSKAPRKLEVDRAKGIVRVSFAIDGHTVVETWRIKGVH